MLMFEFMVKLSTTTWKNRNYHRLKRVKEEAIKLGLYQPVIIDIGPGGLVKNLFNYFPAGKKDDWTTQEKLMRGIIRLIENPLRKTGLFELETSEPREIADMFEDLHPKKIYIVDSEPKVIESVKRIVHSNRLSIPFDYMLTDIALQQIPCKGDIVISYFVTERTNNFQKSLETISNSVNKGGLLSTTGIDTGVLGFVKLNEGVYLKKV